MQFQLFVTVVCCALVPCMRAANIEMVNGQVSCDSLLCPPSTDRCLVTRQSTPDTQLVVHRECFARGRSAGQQTLVLDNPYRLTCDSRSESSVGGTANTFRRSSTSSSRTGFGNVLGVGGGLGAAGGVFAATGDGFGGVGRLGGFGGGGSWFSRRLSQPWDAFDVFRSPFFAY